MSSKGRPKTPYLIAGPPAAAAGLTALRWLAQPGENVYTTLDTILYVPDPDLGWRAAESAPLFVGLDLLAALVAAVVATLAAAYWIRRRERRTGERRRRARRLLTAAAIAPLAVPAAAFLSGTGPDGVRAALPASLAEPPDTGVEGSIPDMPAGTYEVAEHPESNIVASLEAGGDTFQARWETGVSGYWRGDPGDFRQPMAAEISVEAALVETGIGRRDEHTREYLEVDSHPTLGFELRGIDTAGPDGGGIAYSARGEAQLMGRRHDVRITGALRPVSPEARERLDLPGGDILVATAEFSLHLEDTALADDADSFDALEIPIRAALVLRYATDQQAN